MTTLLYNLPALINHLEKLASVLEYDRTLFNTDETIDKFTLYADAVLHVKQLIQDIRTIHYKVMTKGE